MTQRVYISADYDPKEGDQRVVKVLNSWSINTFLKVSFVDMSQVSSGSVANKPNCRICDLKDEFNRQINASSAVIIIVGRKTSSRVAGNSCPKSEHRFCSCTPYKDNLKGSRLCKYWLMGFNRKENNEDVNPVNQYSYLRHEFEQAKKRNKNIIVVYNSSKIRPEWLPDYMRDFKDKAVPFWILNKGKVVGNYAFIKNALGYE